MMNKVSISSKSARKIVLNSQLLDGRTNLVKGKKGIARTIEKLGYVQIDTISVINRSHHHTLWTRRNDYNDLMLYELQAKDRLVFEYWAHAMAYLPIEDYRYYLPRMRNFENPTSKWAKYQMQKSHHLFKPVMERIRNEGPLSSKDFSTSSDKKSGTWWDWKPAKVALELLFWKGDLMITERKNFRKIYDLRERVLPENIDTKIPGKNELGQFLVRRALSAMGIADKRDIYKFMQPGTARDSDLQVVGEMEIKNTLNDLVDANEVVPVIIDQNHDLTYFALSGPIENSKFSKQKSPQVFFLSPFDNLIIQRERTKRLFGFNYTLECYLPAGKRKYGYFVLPILWGDNFVGRFDPKAVRNKKELVIKNMVFEQHFKSSDKFINLLANKLVEFAKFNNCERIHIEETVPKKIKKTLYSFVKNVLTV